MARLPILLIIVTLTMMIVFAPTPVKADTYETEYNDETLDAGYHIPMSGELTSGTEINGYLETHSDTQGLDVFICDDTDYDDWYNGGSPTFSYERTSMHILRFTFSVPYDDTWYVVVSNNDGSTSVTFDFGVDVDDDNAPFYSDAEYTFTANGEVIENEEYYYIWDDFDAGTEISGHFSTWFETDGVDFFICDADNFDLWEDGDDATGYNIKENYHQANIDSFTIPEDGTWYLVFSALQQADTVTLSVGVDIDTSGATGPGDTDTGPTDTADRDTGLGGAAVILLGVAALLAVVLIVCIVCLKKKSGDADTVPYTPTGPPPDVSTAAPIDDTDTREVVLGALKSYPRISMTELSNLVKKSEDDVRKMTLQLIASGSVSGTFDRSSDEFVSASAASVSRELREGYDGVRELPRCPNCGAPYPRQISFGETAECQNCGNRFTV